MSLGRAARTFPLDQFYQNIVFKTCRRSRPPGWAQLGKNHYAALWQNQESWTAEGQCVTCTVSAQCSGCPKSEDTGRTL